MRLWRRSATRSLNWANSASKPLRACLASERASTTLRQRTAMAIAPSVPKAASPSRSRERARIIFALRRLRSVGQRSESGRHEDNHDTARNSQSNSNIYGREDERFS